MLDLFDVLEEKRKQNALDQLQQLQITNSRHMEKEDYTRYVKDLTAAAGIKQKETFDRDKMDALHALTDQMKQGG
jgi:hypothetical protein